jgi:2-C-methyl-D-erythritol 4-phosphate cytidylyltransferase
LGGLVDRSRLLAMQTPQGFRRDVLVRAHSVAAAGDSGDATDDAALVEAIGVAVVAVRGDERAFKITVPIDLALAEALADG